MFVSHVVQSLLSPWKPTFVTQDLSGRPKCRRGFRLARRLGAESSLVSPNFVG